MMHTQINTKRIWIFLAIAFGVPWAAALAFYLSGMLKSNPSQAVMLVNYVFISTPALANIATRLITREGWGHIWLRPNFRRGWKFYLAAWLLPLLAMIIGCLAFYLIFPQSFDPNFARAREQIAVFRSAAAAGPGTVMFALTLELMVIQGLFISVLALGEEFGWRAYLLQKLTDRFGNARKAALLIGLIWAVWHMPLLFMGLGTDPNISDTRQIYIFVLIYPLSTISSSLLLAWATLRSGSVWPAAIGHATLLGVGGLAMGTLQGPINLVISPNPQSLIGNLGFIVLALVLYFNGKAFVGGKQPASAESMRITESPTLV
jgi:membrane protease YdiL (CAAX protease family)